MARALYSIMVCVIVMLAVPVSQLRLVTERVECCCPDKNNCHCPHDVDGPEQTTIKSCHKSSTIFASPSAPEILTPDVVALATPAERITTVEFAVTQPHESPSPERPRGPS